LSSESWFWAVNVFSNYWFLVTLNGLLLLTLFISAGLFSWIPKFIVSVFIWSILWGSIALTHNVITFSTVSSSWNINNYLIESLWEIIKVIWRALPLLWENISIIYEILSWQWIEIPNTNDLGHLVAALLITFLLASKKSKKIKKLETLNKKKIVSPLLPDSFGSVRSTNFNRSVYEGPVDYRALVHPDSVRSLAVSLASNFKNDGSETLLRAATFFNHIKDNVTYVSDDIQYGRDFVAPPTHTLDRKKGDCDDQAVLMASLLSAVGIKNRMLLIGNNNDEWHLATEFCIDLSMKETFVDLLNKFYENLDQYFFHSRVYLFFEEQDGIWLLADTTRDYIADYQSLLTQGFLIQTDSGFNWHNCRSIH
jgi:predicted transglutaminase-like cysteine proteinase